MSFISGTTKGILVRTAAVIAAGSGIGIGAAVAYVAAGALRKGFQQSANEHHASSPKPKAPDVSEIASG